MAKLGTDGRETWTSSTGFILAAIGSAVGLGNIWRFPGVAYESGGGAFLIPYLIALLSAGIPILFLSYAIGHRYRGSAPLSWRRFARWSEPLGWFQMMICFLIAIYYAAIVGWAMSYFVFSFDLRWGDDAQAFFLEDYLQVGDPEIVAPLVSGVAVPMVLVWVLILVVMILGVASGVQKVNMVFIPLLVVAFVGLVLRAVTLPGAADGLNAFFTPNWGALTDPAVWIAAYSQIFFSLSIAFGIMVTYASYQRRKANMTTSGLVVGFANSSFEILAGIGVFATLGFMAHQQSTQVSELEGLTGPILSFVTFPTVIAQMPGGNFFGMLFFLSLLLAGFTSVISIVQVIVAGVQDKFGMSRTTAAVLVTIICALPSFLLFATTSGLHALDTVDAFINNIGIVSAAIAMCIIVVLVTRKAGVLRAHLNAISTFKIGPWWTVLIGTIVPLALLWMLVEKLISFINEGYGGLPSWYLGVFGWGSLLFAVLGAVLFSLVPWKGRDDETFTPWPELEEEKR